MNGVHGAFQGRIGTDPEQRFTATGKALLTFSVAVDENRPGGDGAETQWVRVTAWEQLGAVLHKGDEIYCEGRLKLNTWTTAAGEQRSGLNCSAWTVQPLGAIGRRSPNRPAGDRLPEWDAVGPAR